MVFLRKTIISVSFSDKNAVFVGPFRDPLSFLCIFSARKDTKKRYNQKIRGIMVARSATIISLRKIMDSSFLFGISLLISEGHLNKIPIKKKQNNNKS